jgi:hypothetical protein
VLESPVADNYGFALADFRAAPVGGLANSPFLALASKAAISSAVRYRRPAIFTGRSHPAFTHRHPVVSERPRRLRYRLKAISPMLAPEVSLLVASVRFKRTQDIGHRGSSLGPFRLGSERPGANRETTFARSSGHSFSHGAKLAHLSKSLPRQQA